MVSFGTAYYEYKMIITLNSPISVGHSKSLEPTLIFNPCQIFNLKVSVDQVNCFCRKFVWIPLSFYATSVLELKGVG